MARVSVSDQEFLILQAPGFCNLETEKFFNKFPDVSKYTHIAMRLRSEYNYGGFKFSFAADTINPQFKSFKVFPIMFFLLLKS